MTDSQQVSWWSVYQYAVAEAARFSVDLNADRLPVPGTPVWCSMPDGGPKFAALLLLGAQYALHLDIRQSAQADASHEVSIPSADEHSWRDIAREIHQRSAFRESHQWAKRVAS